MNNNLKQWEIGEVLNQVSLNKKVTKIETINGTYILKKTDHSSIERLIKEHQLVNRLKEEGIRIPTPIKTKNKETFLKTEQGVYCLYEYIDGKSVREHYAINKLDQLAYSYGNSVAKLHLGLVEFTNDIPLKTSHFLNDVHNWAIPILDEYGYIDDELATIVEYLTQYELIYETLPTQIIHRDLHPSNFLVDDDVRTVIGFLDFELSVKGIRLFDVCYLCTALLGEAIESVFNGEDRKIEQWKSYVSHLVKGYHSRNELTEEEVELIPLTMLLIQFIMSAYFLSIDETDLMHQNLDALKWIYDHRNDLIKQIYSVI